MRFTCKHDHITHDTQERESVVVIIVRFGLYGEPRKEEGERERERCLRRFT